MAVLKTVQWSLSLMGYYNLQQHSFSKRQVTYGLALLLSLNSICVYLFHVANTLHEIIYSIFWILTTIGILISFVSTASKTVIIFILFEKIEKIINEGLKRKESRAMYERTNHRMETISKIVYFTIVCASPLCFVIPKAIVSYFEYYTTNLGKDAFDLSIPVWFPFDWHNPTGYLIAVFLQLAMAVCLVLYLGSFLSLAFGVFLLAISIAKDLKGILKSINKRAKQHDDYPQLLKQFVKFHDLHTDVKQPIDCFTKIYAITLTIVFVITIFTICLGLLMLQLAIVQSHVIQISTVILLVSLLCGFWAFLLVFCSCELGQRFSDAFNEIDVTIGRMKWYLLPITIRKILPTTLQYTQQAIAITFFGSISCSREQFKKVANAVYKYFMAIHKLYN